MKHQPDCNWEKSNCEYKKTHEYCPHPEHTCTCKTTQMTQNLKLRGEIEKIIDNCKFSPGIQIENYQIVYPNKLTEAILSLIEADRKELIECLEYLRDNVIISKDSPAGQRINQALATASILKEKEE